MNLQKPTRLTPGDLISFISPSAGLAKFFPHRITTATNMFEKLGYQIKIEENALSNRGYVSDTEKNRANDINNAFADPKVKMIICTIGGDHSNQILKYLDFDLIRKNPKIFMGYSDISVLHYAIAKKTNLQTFYGPCVMTQFGEYPEILPYTLEYFNKAITAPETIAKILPSDTWTAEILDWGKKKDLERPRELQKNSGYIWLKEGQANGNIIGGCVPSINHLTGTEYWIEPDQNLFFIDIPEGHDFGKGLALHSLDSYLSDLDNLGLFQKISGLIVGRPYNYSEEELVKLKERLIYYTQGTNYPILMNVNIGHCDPIITIPFGIQATLDSTKNQFSLNEAGVI